MKNGGIIGVPNLPTTSAASGVWGLREQLRAQNSGIWYTLWKTSNNKFNDVGDPLDIFEWAGPANDQNCVITRDATVTDSPYGGVPLKMDVTGSDPHIGSYDTNPGGPWNIATAANGETWEVRVLAKGSAATSIQIFIFGSASDGSWANETGRIGAGTRSITTSWAEYSFQYTFGSANVQAIQTRLDGPDDGSLVDIWFDGLQVYKIS
jgi:hypothetical protein